MTKERLKQYRYKVRELRIQKQKIEELEARRSSIPVVAGKVRGSSPVFPYVQKTFSVEMYQPTENDKLNELIRLKNKRIKELEAEVIEIEKFLQSIEDSKTRSIFEAYFVDGKTTYQIADEWYIDRSAVSKIISKYLEVSHISHTKCDNI